MEVIVSRQDQEHYASITCMIRHYVARRAQVTEGHPHDAAMSYVETSRLTPTELGKECDLLLAGSRSLYPSDHYALQADLRY